ncbi:hypothetical protein PFFCH_01538 [Plasmodium falciparum FCH/4]|uniref:S1 motif domain-containing protein n=1 Tax=Plasmodium falciparum FCH/4 TaxID=1036724 RepID=A0A024VQJ3_PLAFA|nr:hypothetical protein PFFCH_01538 [Plasmodium falciparum FCH/4]
MIFLILSIILFLLTYECKTIKKYFYVNNNINLLKDKKKNITYRLRRNKRIYENGNDLFEYFITLKNEELEMHKEEKKKKNPHAVSYIQKLPKKKHLLRRWKYDLFEKIKEKMKYEDETKRTTKLCRHKFKLPIDFFKLGDQVRAKVVHVQNHLIKVDINFIQLAHLYIKRYFNEKAELKKKYEIGKYIDVVICYIHKKNNIIQVTDNEEEIKMLKFNLNKLREVGYLKRNYQHEKGKTPLLYSL